MNIKRNFEIEKIMITPKLLEKFQMIENRRHISNQHVKNIHGVILANKNPLGVMIVNEREGKWRLIDGNHRIEAVKRFYSYKKAHEEIGIECIIKIYKNLSADEERQVYADEAKRKNESYEDRLNLYKDTIIFWKLTQDTINKFPCKVTIYNQVDSIKFRTIIDSLSTVKCEGRNGYVQSYLDKEEMIDFARELKFDDFQAMKKFITIFQTTFGSMGKNNIFARKQAFIPLFDIFYKNFLNADSQSVIDRFKEIVGKSDVIMYLNMQGREAQQMVRKIMLNYINKGRRYSVNTAI